MAFTKNVPNTEGAIRAVLAITLITLGVFLTGFWKPLSIIAGIFLALTALVRH